MQPGQSDAVVLPMAVPASASASAAASIEPESDPDPDPDPEPEPEPEPEPQAESDPEPEPIPELDAAPSASLVVASAPSVPPSVPGVVALPSAELLDGCEVGGALFVLPHATDSAHAALAPKLRRAKRGRRAMPGRAMPGQTDEARNPCTKRENGSLTGPSCTTPSQALRLRGSSHERRYSPCLCPLARHLRVWEHLRDAIDARRLPCRRVRRVPPVLHGNAEAHRHSGSRGPLSEALRKEGCPEACGSGCRARGSPRRSRSPGRSRSYAGQIIP